jgi:hypothetical protein
MSTRPEKSAALAGATSEASAIAIGARRKERRTVKDMEISRRASKCSS